MDFHGHSSTVILYWTPWSSLPLKFETLIPQLLGVLAAAGSWLSLSQGITLS